MTRRDVPLNDRQIEVLRWVGQGCPPRDWPNSTYKTVAVALQNRRLITISKKGGAWTAIALDAGHHYLAHESYPEGHLQPKKQQANPRTSPSPDAQAPPRVAASAAPTRELAPPAITPTRQLSDDITAAGGTLRRNIADDKTPYGSLVSAINRGNMAPPGTRLVMDSGASYYERIFHFDDAAAWLTTPPREVVEAARVGRWHPVVAQLRAASSASRYGAEVRTRAWRILHAIAMEADERGHTVAVAPAANRHSGERDAHKKIGQLLITIASYRFYLSVRQLDDRTPHIPTPAEVEKQKKWEWARPPRWDAAPGKRLSLGVYGDLRYGGDQKWADSKTLRVRVEDHLVEVLRTMENSVAREREREAAELRKREELAHREAAAEQLIAGQHAEIVRAKVLDRQLTRWQHVRDLREYLDAMAAAVSAISDEEDRLGAAEWLQWCALHVDSLDPLRRRISMPAIRPPSWQEHSALLAQIMAELAASPPE